MSMTIWSIPYFVSVTTDTVIAARLARMVSVFSDGRKRFVLFRHLPRHVDRAPRKHLIVRYEEPSARLPLLPPGKKRHGPPFVRFFSRASCLTDVIVGICAFLVEHRGRHKDFSAHVDHVFRNGHMNGIAVIHYDVVPGRGVLECFSKVQRDEPRVVEFADEMRPLQVRSLPQTACTMQDAREPLPFVAQERTSPGT